MFGENKIFFNFQINRFVSPKLIFLLDQEIPHIILFFGNLDLILFVKFLSDIKYGFDDSIKSFLFEIYNLHKSPCEICDSIYLN